MCQQLLKDPESFEEISAANAEIDQIFIEAIDLDTQTNALTYSVKYASQGKRKSFHRQSNIEPLQDLLLKLAKMHPNVAVLDEKNHFFNKLIFIDADSQIDNPENLLDCVNGILQKLTQIFAIKQNDDFLNFFGIGPD